MLFMSLFFVMISRLFIAALWSTDLLAFVGDVYCNFCHFLMRYPGSGV